MPGGIQVFIESCKQRHHNLSVSWEPNPDGFEMATGIE